MTTLVINAPKQEIAFKPATTYNDQQTPLPPGTTVRIAVGPTAGGPYPKSIQDTNLVPDPVTGLCVYPMASLGVDLTKPNYAVLFTDVPGGESIASNEVGFQNLLPDPPQAVSVI